MVLAVVHDLRAARAPAGPDELAPDSLELLPYVQLGVIEIDLIPGRAKDFTLAQEVKAWARIGFKLST